MRNPAATLDALRTACPSRGTPSAAHASVQPERVGDASSPISFVATEVPHHFGEPGMTQPAFLEPGVLWRACVAAVRSSGDTLTLDRLRSNLAHEPASKFARLAGLLQERERGRARAEDAADAHAILTDLEHKLLAHARLAAARFATFGLLLEALGECARLRRVFRAPGASAVAGQRTLARLGDRTRALVAALCAREAARFADVVRAGVAEVLREVAPESAVTVTVAADDRGGAWVPGADAAAWRDLVRNLVRNAVQACEDGPAGGPRRVDVVLGPGADGRVTLDVRDTGAGMSEAESAAMWTAGASSHGPGRGEGLTEGKRDFLRARGTLAVRSAPAAGTSVRFELAPREVPVRRPRFWELHTAAVPAALLALAAWTGVAVLTPPGEIASGEVNDHGGVVARDASGRIVFQRPVRDHVEVNDRGSLLERELFRVSLLGPLVLSPAAPGGAGLAFVTRRPGADWVVRRLDARGEQLWSHPLAWAEPAGEHDSSGVLTCRFVDATGWGADSTGALALNVRRGDESPTSIQFFSPRGDSLGAYYHPGHLMTCGTYDVDGDGRYELLLGGVNNAAHRDPSFLPADPAPKFYIDCLALLEPEHASGQAFPYATWAGVPKAREEAYVLFPPLEPGNRPSIVFIEPGKPAPPGRPWLKVVLHDGRIYYLDVELRPVRVSVGDFTRADTLRLQRPQVPFLYLHHGERDSIDLPLPGGIS